MKPRFPGYGGPLRKSSQPARTRRVKAFVRGEPIWFDAIELCGKDFIIRGRVLQRLQLKDEWTDEIADPERIREDSKNLGIRADLLTFRQSLHDPAPRFHYFMNWESFSALRIKGFEHWWEKQIRKEVRKKVRKSKKLGVEVRRVALDDKLVKGMLRIFNESPVRQGKRFWHYGKGYYQVKEEMSFDLEKSEFIGAFWQTRLIGFYKLLFAGPVVQPVMSLSTIEDRDKAPNNALMAKAVELCSDRAVSILTYGHWRHGGQQIFLRSNGFERLDVPRYFVGLTQKGRLALRLGLQEGLRGLTPDRLMRFGRFLRSRWYSQAPPPNPSPGETSSR